MRSSEKLTYQNAGVDISKGNEAVERMKPYVKATLRPEVMGGLGGFGGLFALDINKYKEPILVSGTDGVGTKLALAIQLDKHDTIGIDAVAMCVNDILVLGAEPLYFLDYLAVGKLEPEKVADIIKGVAEGCVQAGCALIGGETAEMPGMYKSEDYDIAGFAVGILEKAKMIDGSTIDSGDVIIGIPSSGVHSNGYSLARKALLEHGSFSLEQYMDELGTTLGEELLKPTRIYVKLIHKILSKYPIKGMAHITGGGLLENIPRILPDHREAYIHIGTWPVLPIFQLIQTTGNIETKEMLRTFNMGIGMTLIVGAEQAPQILAEFETLGERAYIIGEIKEGKPQVVFQGEDL